MHGKPKVISVRVTDEQMEQIKVLMEQKNVSASEIMREGFHRVLELLERDCHEFEPLGECQPGEIACSPSLA